MVVFGGEGRMTPDGQAVVAVVVVVVVVVVGFACLVYVIM